MEAAIQWNSASLCNADMSSEIAAMKTFFKDIRNELMKIFLLF
jgi:hypothetical protein